jgi:hypothetical protein
MARRNANGIDRDAESGIGTPANDTGEATAHRGDNGTTEQPAEHPAERIAGFDTADPASVRNGRNASGNGSANSGTKPTAAQRRKANSERAKRIWRERRAKSASAESASSASGKKKEVPLHLAGIEALLLSVHTMGAAILNVPELALDPKEAHSLAEAVSNVAQFYDIPADPKTVAWINLGMCGMTIYGTRALAYSNRLKMEARGKLAAPPAPQARPAPTGAGADRGQAPRPNGATPATPASVLQSHLSMAPAGDQ